MKNKKNQNVNKNRQNAQRKRRILAQDRFEDDGGGCFIVAIFDDDGGVEAEAVLAGKWRVDGARAGNDDGVFGDVEDAIDGANDGFVDEVVDGSGARDNRAGGDDGAAVDVCALVDPRVSADKCCIFDDDGKCADGFEDATELSGGRNMAVFADLCA